MSCNRLEAFSDGVLAIIITIMVLELKVPHGTDLAALRSAAAGLLELRVELHLRRHLLEQPSPHVPFRPKHVSGGILWANLHLLFWLSLFPFATAWMGENHADPTPSAVYGFVLLMAAIAYYILQRAIIAQRGPRFAARGGPSAATGKASSRRCSTSQPFRWPSSAPWISSGLYAFVALMWLIPDRRIEHALEKHEP